MNEDINISLYDELEDIKVTFDSGETGGSGNVDLSGYALKTEIPTKTSQLKNDSSYTTETYVKNAIAQAQMEGGNVDLSNYATKNEIPTKVSQLTNDKGFITGYTESDPTVPNHVKSISSTDISNWNKKSNFSGSYNDLTNKPTIPTKTSDLTNDNKFVSESYVTNAIANAQLGGESGEIDLSGYATKDDLITKVDKVTGKSLISDSEIERLASVTNYNDTEIRNTLKNKANTSSIPTKVSQLSNDKGYLTSVPSEYITETELNAKGFLTSVPSEYVTDTELNNKGYLTEHQDISNLALKSELHSHSNKTVLDGITSAKVTSWDNKSNFSGSYNDLTNKPTIPTVPTKVSAFTNDVGYLTSIPSEYITEEEILAMIKDGFLNKNYTKLPSDIGSINLYTLESGVYQVDAFKNIYYSSMSISSLEDNFQPDENTDLQNYLFPGDLLVHHKETNNQGIVTVNSFVINTRFIKSITYDGSNQNEELEIKFMYWNDLASKDYVTNAIANAQIGGGTGNVSSDTINSIMVVDELPETEVEGVLYLVKEVVKEDDGNLYDPLTAPVLNAYISTSSKIFSSSENVDKSTYLQIEPNTTYKITKTAGATFSIGTCPDEPSSYTSLTVAQKNANGSEQTITSGATDNYLAIFYYTESEDTLTEEELRNSIVVTKVS